MNDIHLKELNKMSKDLGINPILYRNIWAYALAYTYGYSNQELIDEYSYQIVKKALPKVNIELSNRTGIYENVRDFYLRRYGKELVEEAANELDIKLPKKEL